MAPKAKSQSQPKVKDTNIVKKPLTAYNIYYKDNFDRIKKNLGEQKNSTVHAAKAIGKEWKALSEKDKEQWNKRAMEDKQRYEREMGAVAKN